MIIIQPTFLQSDHIRISGDTLSNILIENIFFFFLIHLLLDFARDGEQASKFPHLTLKISQDLYSSWSQVSINYYHTPSKLTVLIFSFNLGL